MQMKLEKDWKKFTSNTYINDKKWHPDIRIVHYAGS